MYEDRVNFFTALTVAVGYSRLVNRNNVGKQIIIFLFRKSQLFLSNLQRYFYVSGFIRNLNKKSFKHICKTICAAIIRKRYKMNLVWEGSFRKVEASFFLNLIFLAYNIIYQEFRVPFTHSYFL